MLCTKQRDVLAYAAVILSSCTHVNEGKSGSPIAQRDGVIWPCWPVTAAAYLSHAACSCSIALMTRNASELRN